MKQNLEFDISADIILGLNGVAASEAAASLPCSAPVTCPKQTAFRCQPHSKALCLGHAVSFFYETEFDILAGLILDQLTGPKISAI